MNSIPIHRDLLLSRPGGSLNTKEGIAFGLKDIFFLAVICVLAGAPVIKIAEIQPLELFLLAHIALLFSLFMYRGFRFRLTSLWQTYGIPNAVFLLIASLLAVASLRLPFFPIPSEPSILRQPLFLSLSRLIEFLLVSFYMVYVADILRDNRRALIFALKAYFCTGVCSAVYGLLSLPVLLASGLELGAYHDPEERVRGFMNEGGPYGLYLISVVACGLMLVRFKALRKVSFFTFMVVTILPALVSSRSKAAATGVVLILGLLILLEKSVWIRAVIFIGLASVVCIIVANRYLFESYIGYFVSAIDTDVALTQDANDDGFGGRAGSLVFLPRMIAAHPITGIGFGNYPIMRNDPAYLQGFTPVDHWDLPGSGLISYAAELGIPLFILLTVIVFLPLVGSFRVNAPKPIKMLAAVQPICLLCGTQINFFYPWLCSAFAVAALRVIARESPCRTSAMALFRTL